jgi:hypothetical protein
MLVSSQNFFSTNNNKHQGIILLSADTNGNSGVDENA